MVKRYKGGLMSSTEAITSVSDARSMWNLTQATQARNVGNWPSLLSTETPGSGSGAGFANGFMTVSNVSVTDSNYTVLNDTPYISTSGGYLKITGRGFVSGCVVYIGGTAATTTTFINSTEVRAVVPATSSNTLMVYVVNPDGSTGIKLNAITFSGTPTWSTGATLTSQITDVAFSVSFSATSDSAVTYTLNTGSTLPPGTSLFANGLFTGTVTGLSSDTTYSFSVVANDAENQDTARTFSVTFTVGDTNFSLTSVLLNAEGNLWIKDSSNNGFTSTVTGDTRPTAFSPYNSSWSGYFDGSSYLQAAADSSFDITGDFTMECWFFATAQPALDAGSERNGAFAGYSNGSTSNAGWNWYINWTTNKLVLQSWGAAPKADCNFTPALNTWYHFAATKSGATTYLFINGVSQTLTTNTLSINAGSSPLLNIGRSTNNANYYGYCIGYISNFRIIKGTALYTATFTPATTLLPVVSTTTSILTLQNNRFVDNSATPKTITAGGTPQVRAFGPFTETDTFSGSGYFDGTGDYLNLTGSANLAFGTSDFTIEHFVYFSSIASEQITYDGRASGAASGAQPCIIMNGTSKLITYYVNGAVRISSDAAVIVGQWYHIAISRVSSVTRMFINGTLQTGTYSDTTSYTNPANRPVIGAYADSLTSGYMNGYISNLRVLNGTGLYTANFTPSTSSLTSVTNTQLLTLQYRVGENSHRFVDEGGNKYIPVRTGEVHQGTFSPFSPAGWSAYFDGTGDYVTTATSATLTPQSTFTVECWIYPTTTGGIIVDNRPASTNGNYLLFSVASGVVAVYVNSGNIGTTSAIVNNNTWTHLAYVRTGGVGKIYVNGGQQASFNDTTTYLETSFKIGDAAFSTGYWLGYISNFRFVNGTAVYTGNFTPQTSSLSSTQSAGSNIAAITGTSTSLLTLQDNRFKDNSSNNFTVTRVNDAKIQAFSPFRASAGYSPTVHGGSAYFDGSGDYLKALSTSNTLLPANNTNTFTIDGWLYPTTSGSQKWIVGDMQPDSSTNNVSVDISASNFIELYWWPGGAGLRATSTTALQPNQWNYFAIVVNNNAITIYVNSTTAGQSGTTTLTTRSLGTTGWGMGQYSNAEQFVGYMSGIRWSTGIARTISAIPTAPPAPDSYTTLLLNFTHSGIIDHSGRYNIYTYTGTNIRSSNVQSKFGGGSIFFTGSYQWLFIGPGNTSTYPPLLPTIGDFTAECWIYPTAGDITLMALNTTPAAVAAVRVSLNANGTIGLLSSTNGSTFAINATSGNVLNYNAWQHFAVVRNGGNIIVYHNGTAVITSTAITATTALMAGTESMLGGLDFRNNVDFISFYNGYIDDFRVTRLARYTGNFTPTTTAFLTR